MTEKRLPDFDDMINLSNQIGKKKTELLKARSLLDELRAFITTEIMGNKLYWEGNSKPPSNAHIRDTYQIIGYNEETRDGIRGLLNSIAVLEGEIETLELTMRVYFSMIDVWRTQSANQRLAVQ